MLNRTRFFALALAAMLLFILFGCGGGGSSSNNPGSLPSSGTPMSWQSKLAVMDAVGAKMISLPRQDLAADNQAIQAC